MDNVISLTERRQELAAASAQRPRNRFARTTFAFDLMLPQTYLAAERVDQMFSGVRWQPASSHCVWTGGVPDVQLAAEAEERAAALNVPLVWPVRYGTPVRPAMRAAALAAELGRGAAFVLAASRLAFCGGFDLGDPEVLAEAAAAANVPLELCLAAAGDAGRDVAIDEAGRRLAERGAHALPALRVGRTIFSGEERLSEAYAAASAAERAPALRPISA